MSNDFSTMILEDRPELYAQFEVLKRLGDGAAATVYHVKKKGEDKEYALKILTNDKAFDENTIERFREELKVCQRIRHPNIVEAYEFLTLDGALAYLMEYVQGSDLSKLFREKTLTETQIISIYRQLLPAIHELHKHGVLHRDIKLENILLREDGTVKLSDLGLMKQYSKDLTATGVILGTAHYLPPEYVRSGRYDVRSEVYVLGTMLFEMISGKRWLAHLGGAQALEHLIKTNFSFPIDSLENLSPKLRSILDRCVAINPSQRFQSAKEVLKAFNGEVPKSALRSENSSGASVQVATAETPPKSTRLARTLIVGFGALFLAIIVLAIVLFR